MQYGTPHKSDCRRLRRILEGLLLCFEFHDTVVLMQFLLRELQRSVGQLPGTRGCGAQCQFVRFFVSDDLDRFLLHNVADTTTGRVNNAVLLGTVVWKARCIIL